MLTCCVSGCKNRYNPASRIKFYTIPSGSRQFQVKRRHLWIQAIQRANGGSVDFRGNRRICGDHFVSGQASMDPDRPNYVPSVFTCTKQRRSPKKKIKRSFGYRKRLRRRAKANTEEETSPSDSDDDMMKTEGELSAQTPSLPSLRRKVRGLPEDAGSKTNTIQSQTTSRLNKTSRSRTSLVGIKKRSSGYRKRLRRRAKADTEEETSPSDSDGADMMETGGELPAQTPSPPSRRKKMRGLPEDVESETNTIQSPTASGPNDTSPSLTSLVGIQKMDKMNPVVVLKSVIAPEGGYRCELCSQTFIGVSQFVKHKRQHEEPEAVVSDQADEAEPRVVPEDEPSFPCNMCDRSFTSSSDLKRHKLLHVKDARKCFKCGVLFCRRHNHVVVQPQVESKTDEESDEESPAVEEQNGNTGVSREKSLPDGVEPGQMAETVDDAHNVSPTPLPSPPAISPNVPPLSSLTRFPGMKSVRPSPMPRPPSPILRFSNNPKKSFRSQVPDYPSVFVQPHLPQHPELPSSLKIFSPQHLTSAFLEVQRNYKYILSKPRKIKIENVVKAEPNEPVRICPEVKAVKGVKKEKIAYDLEIEI